MVVVVVIVPAARVTSTPNESRLLDHPPIVHEFPTPREYKFETPLTRRGNANKRRP